MKNLHSSNPLILELGGTHLLGLWPNTEKSVMVFTLFLCRASNDLLKFALSEDYLYIFFHLETEDWDVTQSTDLIRHFIYSYVAAVSSWKSDR